MTITFNGHISKVELNGPELLVCIQTPMEPCNGKPFVVNVPRADAAHWLPGQVVSFTIYTLPDPAGVEGSKP